MLHTKFQAPEPSSSGEEDFDSFLNPRPPRRRAISDPKAQGHHSNKLGRGPLGNATNQISRP